MVVCRLTILSSHSVHVQETRQLLTQRDQELTRLRSDLERYKQQTVREIANKTKLAQALDDSHQHAREMEELMQQWQIEVDYYVCPEMCNFVAPSTFEK